VRLWDLDSGHCLRVLEGHTDTVVSVDLSADGHVAVSAGGYDRTLRLWEIDWEL
jgi:WD40 repeat protein